MSSELVDRVNLEHLDLICEALDCDLDEIMIRVPNDTPKLDRNRSGKRTDKNTASR